MDILRATSAVLVGALAFGALAIAAEDVVDVGVPVWKVGERIYTRSPNARLGARGALQEEIDRERGASRIAGRAWLEGRDGAPPRATAGESGSWVIVYEADGEGIAPHGGLRVQIPPFLGWSPPQLDDPGGPGFVRARLDPAGPAPRLSLANRMLLRVELATGLAPGQRVRVVYGAGAAGARADSSAEKGSRFWLEVDARGDGRFRYLPDSPRLDVAPGAPQRLFLSWPSTARPGDRLTLRAAVLDANGNAGVPFVGELSLSGVPESVSGPRRLRFRAQDAGVLAGDFVASRAGVFRWSARAGPGLVAVSNPLVVSDGPRILWGDLHGHSNLSDGTGTPDEFFRYLRDVAGVEVAALTDHDHWGAPAYLDQNPQIWSFIGEEVRRFHAPGRFVTLLGYEWTSWIHGHRHVLYFEDAGEIYSAMDSRFDTPPELWRALTGAPALTFAHHQAGLPVATNWAFAPDPELEPLTEIVSGQGSSESSDTPLPVPGGIDGFWVRDALAHGYRLGFIGSSDSHDGHPGCARPLAGKSCGLAAILSEEVTRESVLAALRERRSYATNGPRIVLRASLDDAPMGSSLPAAAARTLSVQVVAPDPLAAVEVVRGDRVVHAQPGEAHELAFDLAIADLRPGETLYVRVRQRDGGAAWSSPFFTD